MNEKYVLILGAGLMQRPAINAAKNLGYKALVVDANDKAVCVKEADRFEKIDLKDKEGLVKLALSLKPDLYAVFTAGTDFSASVSYVAQKCNLKAHTFEAATAASDKILMREHFSKCNVSSPSFKQIDDKTDINDVVIENYPKVIKPVDNMGARGCRMIRQESEKDEAIKLAVSASRSGRAILEDYMDGPEFSIDAIVYNGTLTITGFADRHIYYPPYFIEMGHTMPTAIDMKTKEELINCFANGIHALGLTHGVAKADIKYTKDGPMIGEIAGRLSGGYMSGWTYPYASDFDLTKNALLLALDKKPEELERERVKLSIANKFFEVYEVECKKSSAERAWISIPGKVKKVYGLQKAQSIEGVRDVLPRNFEGDYVQFPINNVSKCGNIIAVQKDYKASSCTAEQAVSEIVIRLDESNEETLQYLMQKPEDRLDNFPPEAYPELKVSINDNEVYTEGQSFLLDLPKEIEPFFNNVTDYNHRTIEKTLSLIDEIYPNHPEITKKDFWSAIKAGGIQGALYILDKRSV